MTVVFNTKCECPDKETGDWLRNFLARIPEENPNVKISFFADKAKLAAQLKGDDYIARNPKMHAGPIEVMREKSLKEHIFNKMVPGQPMTTKQARQIAVQVGKSENGVGTCLHDLCLKDKKIAHISKGTYLRPEEPEHAVS